MEKVLLAMSGGVDSSVAAKVLQGAGCTVAGATFRLFSNEDVCEKSKTCCSLFDVEDARSVAYRLGMEHFVFNFSERFGADVIRRFADMYQIGRTPNPCIDCNKYIKFDEFLGRAIIMGYDSIATGHYAGIETDTTSGRYLLKRARDLHKDQTYMLYGMTQKQLEKTRFPLNALSKQEVRRIAEESGFVNAAKPDSQDICFVRNGDYAAFIENYTGKRMCAGNFIDTNGKVLGQHQGIHRYTVGQRRGLSQSFGRPLYVTAKDAGTNTVTLGNDDQLYTKRLIAENVNWIALPSLRETLKVTAKTRYRQQDTPAMLIPLDESSIVVEFDAPQRAIASGQAVVFYDGDIVVGGGTIH